MYAQELVSRMSIEISGFDELDDTINELIERVESLGGELPMADLFPDDFMHTYTEFNDFDEFLGKSQWKIESQEDFEEIPENQFDRYVDEHTGFNDWETMLEAAGREYILRQLNAN